MNTASEVFEWAKERVDKQHLPLPAKPRGTDQEYTFPDDPSTLTMAQLGQTMLKLAGFYGYCARLLGLLESELVLVEAEYRLGINSAGLTLRGSESFGKRPSAEVVEAAVLSAEDCSEELKSLRRRRLELLAVKAQLDSRTLIYEKNYQALSREQSRREVETRVQ